MSSTQRFEDDDLALYALRLLPEPESSAIARHVAQSELAKLRLAQIQIALGAYAEAEVEVHASPPGGLERLMKQVAEEKNLIHFPQQPPPTAFSKRMGHGMPWLGWAAAAASVITAGVLYRDQAAVHREADVQAKELAQISAQATSLSRERDNLLGQLAGQNAQLASLQAKTSSAKSEAADLRTAIGGQSARLAAETAKANEQAALAVDASQQRDVLRGTVAAQANQVARLTAQTGEAQQVLDVLRDPTALRVTLTKPKAKPTPTGRATYVARQRMLVFLASNLAPLKSGKVYELWLMPADGAQPVPAGTFAPDAQGNVNVIYAQLSLAPSAKGFSVTIENAGGSSIPTPPLVLAGT